MTNLLESDLRRWLRSVWSRGRGGIDVQWVEPAKGSSIGFPDAIVIVHPVLLPIELKLSKRLGNGKYVAVVRPVQRRFHLLMKNYDMFSCFLLAVGEKNNFEVWLAHNSFPVWEQNDLPGEVMIAHQQNVNGTINRIHFIKEILNLMKKHDQSVIRTDRE